MDSFTPMECGSGIPILDDSFSLSALLSLDNYTELCSPSTADQVFSPFSYSVSPFSYSAFQQIPNNWTSHAAPNVSADNDALDGQKTNSQSGMSSKSPRTDNLANVASASASADISDERITSVVPKSIPSTSLAEKMLRALSLFKESSGGGILAQVWMPVKHGNGYVLSTMEQPFLLDQILAGYREVSRAFTFSAEETPGLLPGLPGRVFISGMPEWTSNIMYYNRFEFLRTDYALSHEVRGSLAVPVFDPQETRSCCAVLELVTTKEKPNFDMEMESVCNALQAVDLRTIKARAHKQTLTKNQKSAFTEILDVLKACCHAHKLPLALTWVPFSYDGESVADRTRDVVRGAYSSLRKKSLLSIQDSACYVSDTRVKGFLHACSEHCLEKGQGIAGKVLQSNHPFFSPDVKGYDIREYPLVHHARKFGLHAAVAIRLRSTYTGTDDYILEFFLPVNCRGNSEQQELLNNLSSTMQAICRSLRTVSDAEVVGAHTTKACIQKREGTSSPSTVTSINHPQQIDSDNGPTTDVPFEDPNTGSDEQGNADPEQFKSESRRHQEKKRSTTEKNISLSVLQQYFSGSLKDAAKSIGVCPTTLKRICRQHGISRWPSRKIKKVNHSLKKIQHVINSVQGVEGALKYDPTTGCLVAAVSSPEKPTMMTSESADRDAINVSSVSHIETKRFVGKLELDDSSFAAHQIETPCQLKFPNIRDRCCRGTSDKGGLSLGNFQCQIPSRSSDSMAEMDEMNAKTDVDMIREHSPHSSSMMTDSSSGSASSCPTFRESSKGKVLATDSGTTITVKATYKEDTVRFKFIPSLGCHQLFEEIGKRFKLSIGTFQLKYMDDEEEWVMLVSDSDLHECIDVLESIGSRNVKLLVRDMPCVIASSGGSNCFLGEK